MNLVAVKNPIILLFCLLLTFMLEVNASAHIHSLPIIIPGFKIKKATLYPIENYRLFKVDDKGKAHAIPFQIDEINEWGDYVLSEGNNPNSKTGNGVFDLHDELSFMGNDVGLSLSPQIWSERKPDRLFEIKFFNSEKSNQQSGSVFLGVYLQNPPPKIDKKYVVFDKEKGNVATSKYLYDFDNNNYLVIKSVGMFSPLNEALAGETVPVIDSSAFYLNADFKYFITLKANHRSVNTILEAYKSGPIRTIVRVDFYYRIMKLNFNVGMYTEVSFFSNLVVLPAIMYNPLDGGGSFNKGSGFYYGLAMHKSPNDYKIDTNMKTYPPKDKIWDIFKDRSWQPKYWISMIDDKKMIHVELIPSRKMLKNGNVPYLYIDNASGAMLASRVGSHPLESGLSPINVGLYFDLTKFDKGEHLLSFQLFFENKHDPVLLESVKNISRWYYRIESTSH